MSLVGSKHQLGMASNKYKVISTYLRILHISLQLIFNLSPSGGKHALYRCNPLKFTYGILYDLFRSFYEAGWSENCDLT